MSLAAQLHAECESRGLPVTGVSIGRANDKSTWKIQGISAQAAQTVIDEFDVAAAHAKALAKAELALTDARMARIVEDLCDTLVRKGVIRTVDLPGDAAEVLQTRREARNKL